MAVAAKGIKITPKLIELEDRIIRAPNIAQVAIGPDPNAVKWGWRLILVAGVLALYAFTMAQSPIYRPNGYGTEILIAITAAGLLAVGVVLLQRRALYISTADSRVTLLVNRNEQFMRDVLARIKEALLADESASIVYQVNIQAERIERLDASATTIADSAGATIVRGDMDGGQIAPSVGDAERRDPRAAPSPAADSLDAMLDEVSGRQRPRSDPPPRRNGGPPPSYREPAQPAAPAPRDMRLDHAPGAVMVGGNVTGSTIATEAHVSYAQDYDLLMQRIAARFGDQHQQILDYLAPVRDHLAGGKTSREEAAMRWSWFAGQPLQWAANIEGVLALAGRIGRVLGM
ncbi:MAG: hypothetical protein R3D31_09220 [Hyphomicrobiaceae bacterium]